MALVEPLITEVTDATDVLTEEFIQVAKGARHNMSHTASKSRIESALRRVYTALNDYRTRSARAYGSTSSRLREMTDRAVDALQEQVEKVISLFVEFIQLSLQSLMSKADMDLLFQRQQKLALAMHAMSQQGGSGNF
jgi:DNA-binding ferritin-like protein